jgi:hypothetical protein
MLVMFRLEHVKVTYQGTAKAGSVNELCTSVIRCMFDRLKVSPCLK